MEKIDLCFDCKSFDFCPECDEKIIEMCEWVSNFFTILKLKKIIKRKTLESNEKNRCEEIIYLLEKMNKKILFT